MTASQKIAFQFSFSCSEDFTEWMKRAKQPFSTYPWENGGRSPEQYTWAKFEALDGAQKIRPRTILSNEFR